MGLNPWAQWLWKSAIEEGLKVSPSLPAPHGITSRSQKTELASISRSIFLAR